MCVYEQELTMARYLKKCMWNLFWTVSSGSPSHGVSACKAVHHPHASVLGVKKSMLVLSGLQAS